MQTKNIWKTTDPKNDVTLENGLLETRIEFFWKGGRSWVIYDLIGRTIFKSFAGCRILGLSSRFSVTFFGIATPDSDSVVK